MASQMYKQFYTGADVMVIFTYPPTGKSVIIDDIMGIGFKHELSSSPVYTLGNQDPLFFSKGNSLGQGQLEIAFSTDKYLYNVFNHLMELQPEQIPAVATEAQVKAATDDEFAAAAQAQKLPRTTALYSKSIVAIPRLFDIQIVLNNTNSEHADTGKTYTLYGVKITSESMGAHSNDDGIIYDTYSFMFKNLK